VARGIEEGDPLAARQLDVIGADVLGDPARLAGDDVGLPDVVEQRSLAVVDVAHDGYHRRPRDQLIRALLGLAQLALGGVFILPHRLESEGRRDQLDLVEVQPLVHRHHQPQLLERELDDLGSGNLHAPSELRY
jgi:hypothetical protein